MDAWALALGKSACSISAGWLPVLESAVDALRTGSSFAGLCRLASAAVEESNGSRRKLIGIHKIPIGIRLAEGPRLVRKLHYTLHTAHYTLHTPHYTLHITHNIALNYITVYIAHIALWIIHHTIRYTLRYNSRIHTLGCCSRSNSLAGWNACTPRRTKLAFCHAQCLGLRIGPIRFLCHCEICRQHWHRAHGHRDVSCARISQGDCERRR